MPDLACPSCGTHLELGLVAVGLQDSNPTTSQDAVDSTGKRKGPWSTDAIAQNSVPALPLPGVRQHILKGHMIDVEPYRVIEAVMTNPYALGLSSRWCCFWVWDNNLPQRANSIRAVLMTFLGSQYPAIDWKTLGITANDAVRIIGQCPGFILQDQNKGGDISQNGLFFYPKKDEWN